MNPIAYKTTSFAIKAIYNLSRAKIKLHGDEFIPEGNSIFVINHFTRIETFVMPYIISKLTDKPVWSLASSSLFKGAFGSFLETLGAVSTKNPDRDKLIIKSMLTGEASWIIFPEGHMVKDMKLIEKGKFIIYDAGGKRPPHTGAATLAMRSEFYRRRILTMNEKAPEEAGRLMDMFLIKSIEEINTREMNIVPVNISYFPVRARENVLSKLAVNIIDDIPDRVVEELMTEGTMLLSGVDIDIRFGNPINVKNYLNHKIIEKDINTEYPFDFDDSIPSRRIMRKEAINLMQEYMGGIYNLITINHDHLFSSLLKKTWFRRIDHNFLKRRVFLIVTDILSKNSRYLHNALTKDQTHLLTDDRYSNYDNFIQIAIKTNILKEADNILYLRKSNFYAKIDFHKIRIENPVAMLANALEPLDDIQKIVSRYARMPEFLVKSKIVHYIMENDINEYEKDYKKYFRPDESKNIETGRPFFLNRKSNKGLLLIHGYMASPEEVRSLAEFMNRLGFKVYAPRLKGHGTAPEDLAIRSYNDWIESVEKGFAILNSMCADVIAGGFSTGAGLALELVSRIPEIKGVIAVNPPMKLQDFSSRFVPAIDTLNSLMKKMKFKSLVKEFIPNNPEHPNINYFRNPIHGIKQLERLMEKVKTRLEDITVPALIVQATKDPIVNPSGSKEIYEKLGSADKTYELVDFERHGILMGEGSEEVYRIIAGFANRII